MKRSLLGFVKAVYGSRQHNNNLHSSIKMTPTETSNRENEGKVYFSLYDNKESPASEPKFKVDDKVRKYKRKVFDKGYTPNWSEEIFVTYSVQYTNPITYILKDVNNEEIRLETFMKLNYCKQNKDVFRIELEEIIRNLLWLSEKDIVMIPIRGYH